MKYVGSIEGGGTKFVCAIGDKSGNIIDKIKFATLAPNETIPKILKFFDQYQIVALTIGSFGPIDMDRNSKTYGYITNSPKLLWKNFDFLGVLKKHFNIPIFWTTDVNIAAYGEYALGAGKNFANVLYVTVGTGVGAGYIYHNQLYYGRGTPEAGHILLNKRKDDKFAGICPYHGDCIEGLVSGPAIEQRTGIRGALIKTNNSVWDIEAYYLAQMCVDYTLLFSPDVIVLGGGAMQQKQLFVLLRKYVQQLMDNYVALPALDSYIVPTELENNSGILGGILLANSLLEN